MFYGHGVVTGGLFIAILGGLAFGGLFSLLPLRPLPSALLAQLATSFLLVILSHDLVRDGSLTAGGILRLAPCVATFPLTRAIVRRRRRTRA